jgi:hypothetical protein
MSRRATHASPPLRTLVAAACLALAPAAAHAQQPAQSPPLPASPPSAPPRAAPAPQASPDVPGAAPGAAPSAPPGYAPTPGYPPGSAPPPGYGQPGYPGYPPPGYGAPGYPPGYAPYPYAPYPYPYYTAPPAPPPPILPYEEGQDVPQGYHVEARANRKLIAAGAGVLGGTWAFSALVAGLVMADNSGNDKGYAPLFVPVVGPFISLGTSHLDFSRDGGLGAFLILDGIAQVGGATLLIVGLVKDKHVLVRDSAPRAPSVPTGPQATSNPGAPRAPWSAFVPEIRVGLASASLAWQL